MRKKVNRMNIEGPLFRQLRKDRGMTLTELADPQNSVSFIGKFERGETRISFNRLEHLLSQINVPFEEFLFLRATKRGVVPAIQMDMLRSFYLTADSPLPLNDIWQIIDRSNRGGNTPADLAALAKIAATLDDTTRWGQLLKIFIAINRVFITDSLHERQTDWAAIQAMTRPVVSYLYTIDNWGSFELVTFTLFQNFMAPATVHQLLGTALSLSAKEEALPLIYKLRLNLLAGAFRTFINGGNTQWAKECLDQQADLVRNTGELMEAVILRFQRGWYTMYEENFDQGKEMCDQAISIAHILDQPVIVQRLTKYRNVIIAGYHDPDAGIIY
ncbi:UpsR [Schleiferilactobacillus perolens DSM 12744]|uniref:UpsR n=2 Tax=Schleiferilactobacillus perolens TaxID=100468 RepID=A0A0R1N8W8_9LACO|nr:UpsR [Schleiferilactobacillus perolens DSM 12744]